MNYVIVSLGILLFVLGAMTMVKPAYFFTLLRKHLESLNLHILAVVVRFIFGSLLIAFASNSKFPFVLEIFGWLSIVAAITLGLIGRSNFKKFFAWSLGFADKYGRIPGVISILFGSFLIYTAL